MRGTGYAIGEILIFLAIAAIIGFLIGWLVFYRRPSQSGSQLSTANPNHVKRLEERSQAVDSKLARIEKRASVLLETLSKTPTAGGKPAAKSPPAQAAAVEVKDKADAEAATAETADTAQKVGAAEVKARAEDPKKPATAETADTAQKVGAAEVKSQAEDPKKPATEVTDETKGEVDGYLLEADDRISKLEETLDKLSEKLAELEGE